MAIHFDKSFFVNLLKYIGTFLKIIIFKSINNTQMIYYKGIIFGHTKQTNTRLPRNLLFL